MTLKTHHRMSIRGFTLLLPHVRYLTVQEAHTSAVSLATWVFPSEEQSWH